MNKLEQAARAVVEAWDKWYSFDKQEAGINALRAALEESAQAQESNQSTREIGPSTASAADLLTPASLDEILKVMEWERWGHRVEFTAGWRACEAHFKIGEKK